jgi:hypothetical protein
MQGAIQSEPTLTGQMNSVGRRVPVREFHLRNQTTTVIKLLGGSLEEVNV